jgi:hypothetical protein
VINIQELRDLSSSMRPYGTVGASILKLLHVVAPLYRTVYTTQCASMMMQLHRDYTAENIYSTQLLQ